MRKISIGFVFLAIILALAAIPLYASGVGDYRLMERPNLLKIQV